MKHLTSTKDLTNDEILEIFKDAKEFLDEKPRDLLDNKLITTIFFENSTRTLSSFESAVKRLKANVLKLDISKSSSSKGETLLDTIANLNSMSPNAIIIRHMHSGIADYIKNHVNCPILNAGDGKHAHPTQALLDLFTIYEHFNGNIKNKKILIVGDIKNSRVATSNIELLQRFGLKISLAGPVHFMPNINLPKYTNLNDCIDDIDILMSLRTQTERHQKSIYASLKDYASDFCINKKLLKDKNIILMHPGPVNRNIDIDDEILNDQRSLILKQVKNGVAIRMSVLKKLILNNN